MKKTFFAGLATLLPLAVTFFVVVFIVNFLTNPFLNLIDPLLLPLIGSQLTTRIVCQILILIGLFFFTLCLGFVARRFFFNQLLGFGEKLLKKIPLVNKVYKTSKEIIHSLFSGKEQSFKRVVLIPFPYPGAYTIGLIASSSPKTTQDALKENLVSIFIPTTPNPMTGYLIVCKESDLIHLEMKSEDALKYVVSCGVIQPHTEHK